MKYVYMYTYGGISQGERHEKKVGREGINHVPVSPGKSPDPDCFAKCCVVRDCGDCVWNRTHESHGRTGGLNVGVSIGSEGGHHTIVGG